MHASRNATPISLLLAFSLAATPLTAARAQADGGDLRLETSANRGDPLALVITNGGVRTSVFADKNDSGLPERLSTLLVEEGETTRSVVLDSEGRPVRILGSDGVELAIDYTVVPPTLTLIRGNERFGPVPIPKSTGISPSSSAAAPLAPAQPARTLDFRVLECNEAATQGRVFVDLLTPALAEPVRVPAVHKGDGVYSAAIPKLLDSPALPETLCSRTVQALDTTCDVFDAVALACFVLAPEAVLACIGTDRAVAGFCRTLETASSSCNLVQELNRLAVADGFDYRPLIVLEEFGGVPRRFVGSRFETALVDDLPLTVTAQTVSGVLLRFAGSGCEAGVSGFAGAQTYNEAVAQDDCGTVYETDDDGVRVRVNAMQLPLQRRVVSGSTFATSASNTYLLATSADTSSPIAAPGSPALLVLLAATATAQTSTPRPSPMPVGAESVSVTAVEGFWELRTESDRKLNFVVGMESRGTPVTHGDAEARAEFRVNDELISVRTGDRIHDALNLPLPNPIENGDVFSVRIDTTAHARPENPQSTAAAFQTFSVTLACEAGTVPVRPQ